MATLLPYKEALDMAIFAINTLMYPEASETEDVERLADMADDIVESLDDLRTTLVAVGA